MNSTTKQDIKTALITGAGRRIGASIAKRLHEKGYNVVFHCHQSLSEAKRLCEEFNRQRPASALVVQQNLCQSSAIETMIKFIIKKTGRLDVLVNNASVFIETAIQSIDMNAWDELFETNVKAPFLLSLAAKKSLMKTGGCIVNITDIHAERPLKNYAIYCQTKAALSMQTKALAKELAPEIRVNAVAPGAIAWPEENNELSAQQKKQIIANTALKRHGKPEHIANAVLALVENDFITGQILAVDGGRYL